MVPTFSTLPKLRPAAPIFAWVPIFTCAYSSLTIPKLTDGRGRPIGWSNNRRDVLNDQVASTQDKIKANIQSSACTVTDALPSVAIQ
jgi:hypothetical protein